MLRPTPLECQPPQTAWGEAWRFAGALVISVLAWVYLVQTDWEGGRALFWLDLISGLVAFCLLPFRRRWPFAVAAAANLIGIVSITAKGAAVLATVSLATRRRFWELLPMGLLILLEWLLFWFYLPAAQDDPLWWFMLLALAGIFTQVGWGLYIGSRRELIWGLERRVERAEAERDLRMTQAKTTERARIAREMHDVLAHKLSQVSMHAGALAYRTDLEADEMRASVGIIQEKANDALRDLRLVLGVLRDDESNRPVHAPLPNADDIASLVEDAVESGMNVAYEEDLRDQPVPDAVGRTLYRIVQEGLTNAHKHAPGALLTVRLFGSREDGITVTLTNPLGFGSSATPGSGLGLIGLTERAALVGGRIEHRRNSAAFELRGWIPWET